MIIPEVSPSALQEAMDRFDKEFRNTPYWANWKQDETYKYAIQQNGQLYPVKQIVSLATGTPASTFHGGNQANGYVEAHGFNVVEISPEERGHSSFLKWDRVAPESFDLRLQNVDSLDVNRLRSLFDTFLSTKWADSNLSINRYLREDLKSWIDSPAKPLRSRVYVTLSNWFLSIDAFKNDQRGKAAGELWDLLFLCRPSDRLSSSSGGNHEIIPERFNRWWAEQQKLQGSIKQMRTSIDLSSAEVLRQLYTEFLNSSQSQEWWTNLTSFFEMIAHASETERASSEFQRKLWDDNPVSAVGQGFISVDKAIEQQEIRNWIASKSLEKLPENPEEVTTWLAELADQMVERLRPYCRQIPYLKIFRVLTAFFPQYFTTITDRGKLRELHLAMFGNTGGPWLPQFESSASHAVKRHTNVLARLADVLGPMNADTAGLVRRITFPWFLYEKVQEQPAADTTPAGVPDPLSELSESLLIERAHLAEVVKLLQKKRQLIFYGPPGTGKTFVARRLGRVLAGDDDRIEIVQFHPSYAYEDFVQGYRPSMSDGQAGFKLVDGALKRLADKARRAPDKTHILIVDEVNRGNLGKVFGELYYLLEYRDEQISLLYSRESFTLPKNLLIISTMNTADRSIALLDAALRRRFYFVPFFPDEAPIEGLLRRWLQKNTPDLLWLADVVDLANRKLGDRHIAIGPSYFMDKDLTEEWVFLVWKHSIIPYLAEHFFGQEDRLGEFEISKLRDSIKTE